MNLEFNKSKSQMIGVQGATDIIKNNALRITGGLKLISSFFIMGMGNPLMIGYALLMMSARIVMLMYGNSEEQKKRAEEAGDEKLQKVEETSLLQKMLSPREYPVESSSAIALVAQFLSIAYGVTQFSAGETGYTPILAGVTFLASYAFMVFGRESEQKNKDAPKEPEIKLEFSKSMSDPVGFAGDVYKKLSTQPIMVASFIQIGGVLGMITGYLTGEMAWNYGAAGGINLLANLTQAFFVTKKGFNIEGAKESLQTDGTAAEKNKPSSPSWASRTDETFNLPPGLRPA